MPGREVEMSPERAVEALQQRGCGAWVGTHGCGARADKAIIGQTELHFAAYLRLLDPATLNSTMLVCPRHDPEIARANLTRDMDPGMREKRTQAMYKAFRMMKREPARGHLLAPEGEPVDPPKETP